MACNVGDVIRAAVRGKWQNASDHINVYHYQVGSQNGSSYPDADVIVAVRQTLEGMYNEIRTLLTDELSIQDVDIVNVTQNRRLSIEAYQGNQPSSAVEPTVPGVAALVLAPTSGLKVMAKKFIGGLTEALLTDGILNNSWLVLAAQYAAKWLLGYAAPGGLLLIPVAYNVVTETIKYFTEVWASANPAYQRRRRIGTGS